MKDSYESKYQFLTKRRESIRFKHFNDTKAFIEYSNDMKDVYNNVDEYKPGKKLKIVMVFANMIAGTINNKKLNSVVTVLSVRFRKLNISLTFNTQSYFRDPKKLNSTHFFIMKIPNKGELQQIALDSDIGLQKMYCRIIFFFS